MRPKRTPEPFLTCLGFLIMEGASEHLLVDVPGQNRAKQRAPVQHVRRSCDLCCSSTAADSSLCGSSILVTWRRFSCKKTTMRVCLQKNNKTPPPNNKQLNLLFLGSLGSKCKAYLKQKPNPELSAPNAAGKCSRLTHGFGRRRRSRLSVGLPHKATAIIRALPLVANPEFEKGGFAFAASSQICHERGCLWPRTTDFDKRAK